jgi:hypothetical protein
MSSHVLVGGRCFFCRGVSLFDTTRLTIHGRSPQMNEP